LAIKTEVQADKRRKTAIPSGSTIKQLLRNPLASVSFVFIFLVIICAIFASQIAPYGPTVQHAGHYLEGPSATFLLGTDMLGRDVLSRIIHGSRVALLVGIASVGVGTAAGVLIGLISAYFRGWVDIVLMRIMDALLCFPSLVLAIAIIAALGSSLTNVIVAIGFGYIAGTARIVRSQALSVAEQDFVAAAHATGGRDLHIIVRHVWPNCISPVIVLSTLGLAYAILAEAGLSFIGVGVQPPTPTWGNMLYRAFGFLDRAPLLSIVPGVVIFLTVLAFNLLGDALRDVLDPRLRGLG